METTMQLFPVRTNNNHLIGNNNVNHVIDTHAEVIETTVRPTVITASTTTYRRIPFVEANTKEVTIHHLTNECVVPVFSKDNEITISHPNFIETVWNAAHNFFQGESISEPDVRVSHVIKGRVPEAIHKPVN